MEQEEGSKQKELSIGHEKVQDLLYSDQLSWQSIIYDLINSEQLDPWDVDISSLAEGYLDRIKELEEANFFVSSKILLAASLLLRIKSELLLNSHLQSLDDILFGKKEEKKYSQERIELEDEIPDLIPRTPLPRHKKVTLQELMGALGKAIKTETRRIKRVVVSRQQEIETSISVPKKTVNLKDKIKDIYDNLRSLFESRKERLAFSEFAGQTSSDRISTFIPLLHLDNQRKVFLEQEGHLDEIWIWMKNLYEKHYAEELEAMKKEVEAELEESSKELDSEERRRVEKLNEDFENPLADLAD